MLDAMDRWGDGGAGSGGMKSDFGRVDPLLTERPPSG